MKLNNKSAIGSPGLVPAEMEETYSRPWTVTQDAQYTSAIISIICSVTPDSPRAEPPRFSRKDWNASGGTLNCLKKAAAQSMSYVGRNAMARMT